MSISSLPNMVFTFLVCLMCWYVGYDLRIGFPVTGSDSTSLIWDVFCGFLTDRNFVYLAGFSLLLLSASFIQRIHFIFMIVQGKTTLPFLLFFLLNSANPDFYPIHPGSIAIFLLIFAIFELFGSYQNPSSTGRIFNLMVSIGVGSLIWPHLLLFIPVFLIGMYQFRILNTRTFFAGILGLLTVFWFVLGWCVWKSDFTVFTNLAQCLSEIHIVFTNESRLSVWLKPLFFFFLMIVLLFHISTQESERTIRTRHFLTFIFMLGFYSFILSLLYAPVFVDFEYLFYLSVSIIASCSLSGNGIRSYLFYYLLITLLIGAYILKLWIF
ncbi:MAG: hypothetical protein LBE79_08050 [Tannerella sp.]|nr:hypothetical protein [Tannerella sp.]